MLIGLISRLHISPFPYALRVGQLCICSYRQGKCFMYEVVEQIDMLKHVNGLSLCWK